jgi:hypothetical protein
MKSSVLSMTDELNGEFFNISYIVLGTSVVCCWGCWCVNISKDYTYMRGNKQHCIFILIGMIHLYMYTHGREKQAVV